MLPTCHYNINFLQRHVCRQGSVENLWRKNSIFFISKLSLYLSKLAYLAGIFCIFTSPKLYTCRANKLTQTNLIFLFSDFFLRAVWNLIPTDLPRSPRQQYRKDKSTFDFLERNRWSSQTRLLFRLQSAVTPNRQVMLKWWLHTWPQL